MGQKILFANLRLRFIICLYTIVFYWTLRLLGEMNILEEQLHFCFNISLFLFSNFDFLPRVHNTAETCLPISAFKIFLGVKRKQCVKLPI
jgi:hypothetical protein